MSSTPPSSSLQHPRVRAPARLQHHTQDADAEPGVPEAGVVHFTVGSLTTHQGKHVARSLTRGLAKGSTALPLSAPAPTGSLRTLASLAASLFPAADPHNAGVRHADPSRKFASAQIGVFVDESNRLISSAPIVSQP